MRGLTGADGGARLDPRMAVGLSFCVYTYQRKMSKVKIFRVLSTASFCHDEPDHTTVAFKEGVVRGTMELRCLRPTVR